MDGRRGKERNPGCLAQVPSKGENRERRSDKGIRISRAWLWALEADPENQNLKYVPRLMQEGWDTINPLP